MNTDQRIKTVQNELKSDHIDALLVSNYFNILWLTGFAGLSTSEREAWVLVTKHRTYLFTDGRYYENVKAKMSKLKNLEIKLVSYETKLLDQIETILLGDKVKKLGFEQTDLSFYEYTKVSKKLKKIELIDLPSPIAKFREIKDTQEVKSIRKACLLADKCLAQVAKLIEPGVSETELAFTIEHMIKKSGYEPAFYPIVAVDASSSLPHYDTRAQGSVKVKSGSVVLIDFGVKYNNYNSDITRMFFVDKPQGQIARLYSNLLDIQTKTIDNITKSKNASDIDSYCRSLINNLNLKSFNLNLEFPHSTGHGIGLEVHEGPRISQASKDKFRPSHVFTIEPGIYLPGKFGMRIEDTVMIDASGKALTLTKFSKKLTII